MVSMIDLGRLEKVVKPVDIARPCDPMRALSAGLVNADGWFQGV
jgi:hypothetical protein